MNGKKPSPDPDPDSGLDREIRDIIMDGGLPPAPR